MRYHCVAESDSPAMRKALHVHSLVYMFASPVNGANRIRVRVPECDPSHSECLLRGAGWRGWST